MLQRLSLLFIALALFNSCSQESDTCSCWEELVTRADNQSISASCEYILEMSLDEIHAEAGPDCIEKINSILFGDDDIEYNEELDENAMFEEIENFE